MALYRGSGTADAVGSSTQTFLRETFTATASQTVFTFTTIEYTAGANQLDVYVNGVKQLLDDSYTESSSTTITFSEGLDAGDTVEVEAVATASLSAVSANSGNVAYTPNGTGATQNNVSDILKAIDLENIAALKLLNGTGYQKAWVNGSASSGDGAGAAYYWDSASTESADNITIVQATGVTTGRWKLIPYIVEPKTPAAAGSTGVKGQIAFDSSYLYVCVATNTWKRVAIATW